MTASDRDDVWGSLSRLTGVRAGGLPEPLRWATAAFTLGVLGAVGFVVALLAGDQVQWEGGALAVAFVGLAGGFLAWSRVLPRGPYVEPREELASTPHEQDTLSEDLRDADVPIRGYGTPRRALTAALATLGLAALVPLRSLARGVRPGSALSSTAWRAGVSVVRGDGTPVFAGDLEVGTALTVFPQGATTAGDAAVILVRVEPGDLRLTGDRMAWTVDGIVGYSKICTHAGCPVGLFAEGAGELFCPCHQSVFDVYDGARPRYGPAARPLPQLPLAVRADGTLFATGPFPGPVGAGYWRQS